MKMCIVDVKRPRSPYAFRTLSHSDAMAVVTRHFRTLQPVLCLVTDPQPESRFFDSKPIPAALRCRCAAAGHCCDGMVSACQKPSCAHGCLMGPILGSETACNASCDAAGGKHPGASGCSYQVPHSNLTLEMCGSCRAEPAPSWWPATTKPPNGQFPGWWPPGYSLPSCSSCDNVDGDPVGECKLGCMFNFRPSMKPVPPAVPEPPAPRPPPPACGVFPSQNGASACTVGGDLNFSNVFGNNMVLQMEPARAAVYGYLGTNASASANVTVAVTGSGGSYSVPATIDSASGTWKAFLRPAAAGGSVDITASCSSGCTGSARIASATFGDVWCVLFAKCSFLAKQQLSRLVATSSIGT